MRFNIQREDIPMRRINRKIVVVGITLTLGFLGLSGNVQADSVLNCQVAKVKAARSRATCLAKEREKKLQGKSFDFAPCETKFDNAIAMADSKAAAKGVACRYIDNGDGTVSDLNSLLQWVKKVAGNSTSFDSRGVGNCLNCVNDTYLWNTAMGEWLSTLNGRTNSTNAQSGFAGFEDWRIPMHIELQTILLEPPPCGTSPCIDPIFGPPTADHPIYWASTTRVASPADAWVVSFTEEVVGLPNVGLVNKSSDVVDVHVRAVRGGR